MIRRAVAAALAAASLAALPAFANDFADPTWPCVQRKVPELSAGLMWPWALPENGIDAALKPEAEPIVARLSLRRVEPAEVAPLVAAYTAAHGSGPEITGALFGESFERLARLRRQLMQGIEDYARKQTALASRIDATRTEMDRLMAEAAPDYDKVDRLEEQLDWDERIYTDRQRSLTYVCESPVLIEKRLYAIAQMLQGATRTE